MEIHFVGGQTPVSSRKSGMIGFSHDLDPSSQARGRNDLGTTGAVLKWITFDRIALDPATITIGPGGYMDKR